MADQNQPPFHIDPWIPHPQRINPGPGASGIGGPRAAVLPAVGLPTTPGPSDAVHARIYDPHHYAVFQEGNVPVGVAGDANTLAPFLLQPSTLRNSLGLRNASTGAANIYIGFGIQASTVSWLKLTPGTVIYFDVVCPQNDLYALADAADGLLSYVVSSIAGSLVIT